MDLLNVSTLLKVKDMLYRIPKFVDLTTSDDFMILTNQVDSSSAKFRSEYRDELLQIYNEGIAKLQTELSVFLYRNNFLFSQSLLNEYLTSYLSKLNDIIKITILPTEDCNFACEYCYENKRKEYISSSEFQDIFNYARQTGENVKYLMVDWFGGEPLLRASNIISANRTLRNIAQDRGLKFIASITTNGYLLSQNLFSDLIKAGVNSYQITLDGEQHDSYRHLKNGDGTFDKILENVSNLKSIDEDFKIIVRRNIDNNSQLGFYKWLADAIKPDDRFWLHIHPIKNFNDCVNSKISYLERKSSYLIEHKKCAAQAGWKLFDLRPFSPCYSIFKNSLIFRPMGKLSKCSICLEEERNLVGGYGGGVTVNQDLIDEWTQFSFTGKCLICDNILRCPQVVCPKNKQQCPREDSYEKK